MTRAEAIRWIKREIAREIRERLAEVPDRVMDAPDPELVNSLWTQATWDAADKIWPEGRSL
jgi:hypothetical protein